MRSQRSCVKWFINQMLTLEHEINKYFKTNIPLQKTPQEKVKFQQSEVCWLCEEAFNSSDTQSTQSASVASDEKSSRS